MKVKHILSRKGYDVFTIEQAATLADAVKLLAERNIGALIVADVSGQIAGIISERDIVRALHEKGTAVLGSPVAGTMTRKVVTCTDAAEVTEITERMTEGKFRHVPVAQHGRLAGIVSIGDVVKARLEELENKLMNVEAVTASIAHEVRQPLAAIAAYSGAALRFLRRAPPALEEVQSALNAITNDSHRVSTVFDSIRALFKSNGQGQESIDVNEIALGVLRILSGELKEHCITVRTDLASELPHVVGHKGQLQEVILNLIQNAIDAMDVVKNGSRVLSVRTERRGSDAIAVSVEDSGPGINLKKIDGIFDAFVTTKSHGIGLGLAICRMIVERHGGELTAAPDNKNGALFQFVLPIEPAAGVIQRG